MVPVTGTGWAAVKRRQAHEFDSCGNVASGIGEHGAANACWRVAAILRHEARNMPLDDTVRAGPDDEEPAYTRAALRANLVTKQGIAEQVQVELANVSNWAARYADWPEPFLPVRGYGAHDGGNGALYWWPDVTAFLDLHDLPKPARTRKTTGGTDGQQD